MRARRIADHANPLRIEAEIRCLGTHELHRRLAVADDTGPRFQPRFHQPVFDREELPARAFYAADAEKCDLLDQALFEAAWVEGLDVNEPETIRWAAQRAGLDADHLMTRLAEPAAGEEARAALDEFNRLRYPGVPTVIVNGQRHFGKDRVDRVIGACRARSGPA